MAISKVTLPDNSTQDIKDSRLPDATITDNGKALVVASGAYSLGDPTGIGSLTERHKILSTSYPLYRYKICGFTRYGAIMPLTSTNQTDDTIVTKTPNRQGIDPQRGLVYYDSDAEKTTTSVLIGNFKFEKDNINAGYTFSTSLSIRSEVYLRGTYDGHTFILTSTDWYVTASVASDSSTFFSVFTSGNYYMYVGIVGNTAGILDLKYNNPLYYFDGTYLVKVNLDSRVQPLLVSGTNIKTINNESLLGSGNISISGGDSLPSVTSADNGKSLVVDGGVWSADIGSGVRSLNENRIIVATAAPLYRYKICGYNNTGKIVPLVVTNQTSATIVEKTPTTYGLDPARGLVFYNSETAVTSTASSFGGFYNEYPSVPCQYTFNAMVGARSEVYLKGTMNNTNGQFYLDNSTTSSWYVVVSTTLTTANYRAAFVTGAYYMYVGCTGTEEDVLQLKYNNQLLYFNGTLLVPAVLDTRYPQILSGSSDPASSLGNDGDIYIQI